MLPNFAAENKTEYDMLTASYTYPVFPEAVDGRELMKVSALCDCAVNAIGRRIEEQGFGVRMMASVGRSWVLSRYALEIDYRPKMYSRFSVKVSDGPVGCISTPRYVRFTDSEGNEFARGWTEWSIIDRVRRSLSRLDSGQCANLSPVVDPELPCAKPERVRSIEVDHTGTRNVGFSDCDFNGHLNNIKYVEMLYDMLPDEVAGTTSPVRLDVNFHREVMSGENLTLGLGSASGRYNFIVLRGTDTACTASLRIR